MRGPLVSLCHGDVTGTWSYTNTTLQRNSGYTERHRSQPWLQAASARDETPVQCGSYHLNGVSRQVFNLRVQCLPLDSGRLWSYENWLFPKQVNSGTSLWLSSGN